ncbi:pimeloyl-ACP methyl ester carboxylesterase [Paraburkholderia sp. BL23I1N1]|uniref:alpha/beta fold hydrolase n=1 Tax=Paraburkholderia sp. BL23I1N1 TaxID=1938802 RepID=UPI000E7353F6|nr:alpha/beta hydrolase [Paraburkholderia sp. BL23I1N1]RKE36978.1 pimeloyl-ACP methyl ester carboxylesterase [Paraburkholderia sp. BL23I1N1]
MIQTNHHSGAVDAPTLYAETNGRTLAYRSIGNGEPLILCVRFRGVLDVWDPAFLDALAKTFRVITFDYSGLGLSTGEASYDPRALAKDAMDLADAIGLDSFYLAGWSLGGQAAQAAAILHPERVRKLILIGTTPPGKVQHGPEAVFFERALKFDNDLDDETVLFFEPKSERSRAAASASRERIAQRKAERSPVVPEETYLRLLGGDAGPPDELFIDRGGYRDTLASTSIPILVISGDHEIVFPVQNWFAVIPAWRTLHLVVIPQAGHGPHHQEPQFCADLIASFAGNIE